MIGLETSKVKLGSLVGSGHESATPHYAPEATTVSSTVTPITSSKRARYPNLRQLCSPGRQENRRYPKPAHHRRARIQPTNKTTVALPAKRVVLDGGGDGVKLTHRRRAPPEPLLSSSRPAVSR